MLLRPHVSDTSFWQTNWKPNRASVFFLILVGVVMFSGASLGYDPQMVKEALKNCSTNQLSLNVCAWHRAEIADKELTAVYQQLLGRLTGRPSEVLLKESQATWIKFRDLDCQYEVSGLTPDGSMVPQWRDNCREARTKQRISEIRKFLRCTQNGCPGQ